jgi:lipopolysaccharide export system permease protein
MRLSLTFLRYISRVFLLSVLMMVASLSGLVALFDFIELLRRAATKPEATFGIVSEIALLRIPWEAMQILPFAVLLGGIAAFWRLTRSSELIVARATGLSAWQFLSGPMTVAFFLGALATGGVSPLAAVMLARAEALDQAYLQVGGGGPISLAGGHLWLRQADHVLSPDGVAILHAEKVRGDHHRLEGEDVTVFRLTAHDALLQRIDARAARLEPGRWRLIEARLATTDRPPDPPAEMTLPTDLTVARVEESFASPDTLSFWKLPRFISFLERSGFSAIRHRLRLQSLLALPVLSMTMTLVAAGFSMRPTRRGGTARMIGAGVASGFALFTISKVAEEFGSSGGLPVVLAAWAPTASGLMLAIALLLHLEDG